MRMSTTSQACLALLRGPTHRLPTTLISGVAVPLPILCDEAFPLMLNLIKPFASTSSSEKQKPFNYQLQKSRKIVENRFGWLKACFRFVMKRMEHDISNVLLLKRASCVPKICKHFGNAITQQWIGEAELQSANTHYRCTHCNWKKHSSCSCHALSPTDGPLAKPRSQKCN